MNYKTFDLFDTVEEQKIKLSPLKGIDADAITALTMEKVGNVQPSYKVPRVSFRKVAILILILIALIGTVLATSATIRNYTQDPKGFWLISQGGQNFAKPTETELTLEPSDPLGDILPEEFELVILDGESFDNLVAIYDAADGKEVFLSVSSSDASMKIDAEGAEVSEIIRILDQEVILVLEDADVRLVWIDPEISTTFVLIGVGLPKEDMIGFAKQVIRAKY